MAIPIASAYRAGLALETIVVCQGATAQVVHSRPHGPSRPDLRVDDFALSLVSLERSTLRGRHAVDPRSFLKLLGGPIQGLCAADRSERLGS